MPTPFRLSAYFGAYFLYAGAYVPYFALYLAARGFSAVEIAAVMAMPQLARIAAPTFWGWLADRSGAARAIVVGSGCAIVGGYLLLGATEGALDDRGMFVGRIKPGDHPRGLSHPLESRGSGRGHAELPQDDGR